MNKRISQRILVLSCLVILAATASLSAADWTQTPTGAAGSFGGTIETGAGTFDPFERNASRSITDLVVPGAVVPFTYTRIFNSRGQGSSPGSGAWRTNWSWGIESWESSLQGDNLPYNNDWFHGYIFTFPDGRVVKLGKSQKGDPNRPTAPGTPGAPGAPGTYRSIPAGVFEYFVIDPDMAHAHLYLDDGRVVNWHMTCGASSCGFGIESVVDPHGQAVKIAWDATGTTITEPGGRWIHVGAVQGSGTNNQRTVVTTSLGQTVTYDSVYRASGSYPGRGGELDNANVIKATSTVTYNDVIDPATNLPVQAQYIYKQVQQPKTGPGANNPSVPDPYPFYRLVWASDPMFEGAVQQVKYIYVDGFYSPSGDENLNAVIEERFCADYYTDPGVRVTRMEMPAWVRDQWLPFPEEYYTRIETRGDGATRTISYFNLDLSRSYVDSTNHLQYTVGAGQNRVDHITDFDNPNVSERHEYDWTRYFPTPIKVTDMRGKVTTRTLEPVIGRITQEVYPGGAHRDWTYTDPAKPYFVWTTTDERGKPTIYTRDPVTHRVKNISYPDGGSEAFTYNSFGGVLTHQMTNGGTETFTYDGYGRKQTYEPPPTASDPAPAGHPTRYYYFDDDPTKDLATGEDLPYRNDRLSAVADPRGNTEFYDYNARGQTITVCHQDGNYTQRAYNMDTGTLKWSADENHQGAATDANQRTRYTYDEYKRVLTVKNPKMPDDTQETTTYSYAPWSGTGPLSHTTASVYVETLASGKVRWYNYDANFRRFTARQAPGTPDDSSTWYDYDEVGNMISTTDPRGKQTIFGYDDRNRQTSVKNALNQETKTTYDGAGNKLTVTRPGNPPIQYTLYDEMNRLKTQIDERGVTTTYGYDGAGNLTSSTDGNTNLYQYTYDDLNRRKSMIYPDGSTETWIYDITGNGNLKTHQNRAGITQTYAPYDNRNRPVSFTWGANSNTQGQTYGYDPASRLLTLSNDEADITYTYDWNNRKKSEKVKTKSYALNTTRTVTYDYDLDGNRSLLGYPQGNQYIYAYTNRNQLDKIQLNGSAMVDYVYDLSGNRTKRTLLNGSYADYTIDELNRIKSQTDFFTDPKNIKFDYGFDALGRRLYEQRNGGTADGFKYDASDELTAFNRDGTVNTTTGVVTGGISTMTTVYDGSGNRQTGTKDGAALTFGRNNLNQYTSTTGEGVLGYDQKGNLKAIQGWTYAYDAQNRLVSLDHATLNVHIKQHYDPMNRVIAWDNNGVITSYVWDGWNLLEERNGTGVLQRAYLYGAAQNEVVEAFGGTLANTWYVQDGRGNTAAVSGDYGRLAERYRYDWNGNVSVYDGANGLRIPTATKPNASLYDTRFLFAGSQYLPEAGLYDMRNRFYHPALSRFMQTDPVGLQVAGMKPSAIAAAFYSAGTAPEKFSSTELNLYRYCHNDPINKSDPMGRDFLMSPQSIGQSLAVATAVTVGYIVLRDGFGITLDDKQTHRFVSRQMTERGDPISAAVIGELREQIKPGPDTPEDRKANFEGIKEGIRNQLWPAPQLFDAAKAASAPQKSTSSPQQKSASNSEQKSTGASHRETNQTNPPPPPKNTIIEKRK